MAKTDFSIRDATHEELPEVIALWSSMMDGHESFDSRIRMAEGAAAAYRAYLGYHLTNEDARVRVAVLNDRSENAVVGFCLALINRNLPMFLPSHYGYLSDLVVDTSMRRRGIGQAMVEDLRQWLQEREIDTIQLQVYTKNSEAAQFWQSVGFRSFYDRMWLDVS